MALQLCQGLGTASGFPAPATLEEVVVPLPVGVKPLVMVVTYTKLTKTPPFPSKFLLPCLKTIFLWKGPALLH